MIKRLSGLVLSIVLIISMMPVTYAQEVNKFGSTIATGEFHTLVVKEDKSLWAWGYNGAGQVGDGTTEDRQTPVKLMDGVISVSASGWHSVAIKSDGSLWAWGDIAYEQQGSEMEGEWLTPAKIMNGVDSVSTGWEHTMVIKSDKSLWAWGSNEHGQLGDGTTQDRWSIVKIVDGVVCVSAGEAHTMAVKADRSLWAWGSNEHGQLGDGTTQDRLAPVKVMDGISTVIAGDKYTIAIGTDGGLWGWGYNGAGQLGKNLNDELNPVRILDDVAYASTMYDRIMIIRSDGSLWTMGETGYLEVEGVNKEEPSGMIKVMDDAYSCSSSGDHEVVVKKDGSLLTWGFNENGELGDGTTKDRLIPLKVMDGIALPGRAYAPGIEKTETAGGLRDNALTAYFPITASTMNSYLIKNDDSTISVVEANGAIAIDTYDEKYNLIAQKKAEYELPLFGGFYSGKQYNYIAFGQENLEENNNKEVIRIVRYNKSFERIDSVSITGGKSYTIVPFNAGSGKMAEYGDILTFHTSRKRYMTEDGLNHQSQLTINISTTSMRVTNDLGRFQPNHVSHSFNQFVLFDGDTNVFVDHGDAYPRSIVLTKGNDTGCREADLFKISGEIGENYTGVSLGGFESSSANYIVAMNTIDQALMNKLKELDTYELENSQRDIMLCVLPRGKIDSDSVKQITYAKYVGSDKTGSIPHLVRMSDDKLILMWQEFDNKFVRGDLKYVLLDKNGHAVGDIQIIKDFVLSECKPIIVDDEIIWYTNENGIRNFYTIPYN